MKKELITVDLNNDMTMVLERREDKYVVYVVMGVGENIQMNDVVVKEREIPAEELFRYLSAPSLTTLFNEQQVEYWKQDFENMAEEMIENREIDYTFSDDELRILAERYSEHEDCDCAQNDMMRCIIEDYLTLFSK